MLTENETSTSDNTGVNEFEKYPDLCYLIQEYASFGAFSNWTLFLEVLNKHLSKIKPGLRWVKASERLPKESKADKLFLKIHGWGEKPIFETGIFFSTSFIGEHKGTVATKNIEWLDESPQPDYHTHLSNLIKIIESLGSEHGHSLNPEFKKQFEDAKKLL